MTTVASKFVLAVAGVVASVASFAAAPAADAPSVSVRYDDLNLLTTAGYRHPVSKNLLGCP